MKRKLQCCYISPHKVRSPNLYALLREGFLCSFLIWKYLEFAFNASSTFFMLSSQRTIKFLLNQFPFLDRSLSYAASVDFTKTKHGNPQYAMVDLFAKNKNSVLLKGVWELELSARSTDLLLVRSTLLLRWFFFG